jgi:hypothetical protein
MQNSPLGFFQKGINLSFGFRSKEIKSLAQDDAIFFEGNRKSAIFKNKRSSNTDKLPENQANEPKTQVIKEIL